jgi:outer membrane lipoprotein SlyB
VTATPNRIESGDRGGIGNDPAAMIGGGAILGTIIGAIAGGGKGAAIGAGVGAAAGAAGVLTQGRRIRVPSGSVVTFRLERDLALGVPDRGYSRGGLHYHRN